MLGKPRAQMEECPYKVYVMLGFHTSFYHSWRGDTPDEAGFGTDIRMVREILRMLEEARARGLQARGYWDIDVYWTLEKIISVHAPDIVDGIRQRVEAGLDEVLPISHNNGANHAATEEEFRTALSYALENPAGSGLKQVFGKVAPICRPQEGMYTTGQNRILREHGFVGMISYYATVSFNCLSTFIPPLPPEQRYNLFWLRSVPDEEPIVVFPCISPPDLLNYTSMEMWMLHLRQLQTSGRVNCDLLLHLNFDADVETWAPVKLPKLLRWFPNTGGLLEYIHAVNKYPWAAFTVPSEYLQTHPPQAEVLVRQDLADGAYDGNYSWAEKFSSLRTWSALERSRLHSYRAMALSGRASHELADNIEHRLWQGTDSSFFQRLVGLSTTHFGMSTPVLNEERQAKADMILGLAEGISAAAEKEAAAARRRQQTPGSQDALYRWEVYNYARGKSQPSHPVKAIVRLPVIVPRGVEDLKVSDGSGSDLAASLVNVEPLPDGTRAAELLVTAAFQPDEVKTWWAEAIASGHGASAEKRSSPAEAWSATPCSSGHRSMRLQNRWLELNLSESSGVDSFLYQGRPVGTSDFLQPFITYRSHKDPQTWRTSRYRLADLTDERWRGLQRARIQGTIPMDTPQGRFTSSLSYTFTLFDDLPYLLVDVEVRYAYVPPRDIIQTMQQKLRRYLDLRWIEVAPFQLCPAIYAPAQRPLRVWKHNYLGVTSYYELNYGSINPKNRNLASFNHQVTAGWVAVTNSEMGLLLAESADELTSMAFCPMRLREQDGTQHLCLNPFGSYYGPQLDYTHMGGNGIGTEFARLGSAALKPNGPSFNGQLQRFSLLLAPYFGDRPPQSLERDAAAFFYPCGIVYLQTPTDTDAVVPEDIRALMASKRRAERMKSTAPLASPTAFLANPSNAAADLVWDAPADDRVTGYEVRWRKMSEQPWQTQSIPLVKRWHIADLENGQRYLFQIRAKAQGCESAWTQEVHCVPGPERKRGSALTFMKGVSLRTLLRLAYDGLRHGWITRKG